MDRKEIISKRLRECRENRRLKMTQVAEMLDFPYSTYANWETGQREPSSNDLARLAEFYRVSMDYLYGFKDDPTAYKQPEIKEGGKPLSALKEIMGEVKYLWNERDKNIKIPKSLYNQLLEDADMREERVNFIVRKIISSYYNSVEEERRKKEEKILKEEELTDYYIFLDRYLNATIGRSIQIGITNDRVGKESAQDVYILSNYKFSQPYRYLTLYLERKNEKWPITFNEIQDIKFLLCGDERLKTWIYMPRQTWRFYLNFDPEVIKDEKVSDKLDLTE
ncbi:helix-turn-helix domain-containing protein [Paenibacillus ehimensis]|uniref:Helix-turn-helix transcriptional regulator n=1 Tax=Paenibacillus ehimensis TaxID=79264 RepID=A0ABT8VM07_9BACL|nr:helix-turn-helix transcriptional regulator [Paenibacillus ehimensis]MDO3682018.1 helix-turn-helix transcriptional regulator [Paenibacillus ehimensis]